MIRVLMTGASNIGKAGVATIAYNLGQAMERDCVEVGYLAQRGISDEKYKSYIEDKGNRVFVMNTTNAGKLHKVKQVIKWIYEVLENNNYEIIHINTDTAYLAAIYIWIAKKAKVPFIVVHSHSTMIDEHRKSRRCIKILLHRLFCPYVIRNANLRLACSSVAGEWLFGKHKTKVIPNGIDLKRFQFDKNERNKYREELGLEGSFVVVAVGRLAYQKNPLFTVDIFIEILKRNPNSKLLFIGEGELHQTVMEYIREKEIEDKVLLLGNREDVPQLLAASDSFVLPSRFEGLGIVYIEAQASGLPVFASDQIPKEAFVAKNMFCVSLKEAPEKWADKILEHKDDVRIDVLDELNANGYGIKSAAEMLQNEYMRLFNRR